VKKRSIIGVAGAAALVAASVIGFSAPAQASITQCGSNRACAWTDSSYAGAFGSWTSSQSSLAGFHDVISSVANNRTAYIGWFSDPGYSGSLFQQPGGAAGFFNWPDWRNDSFDSLYFY